MVSTHSRPKAAGQALPDDVLRPSVSTHSRPKAAGPTTVASLPKRVVSTHSRPKAAGSDIGVCSKPFEFQHTAARRRLASSKTPLYLIYICFNTQPPEGGWARAVERTAIKRGFNTQPPEGGWVVILDGWRGDAAVSTHSRPKAAGQKGTYGSALDSLFQHTAARRRLGGDCGV